MLLFSRLLIQSFWNIVPSLSCLGANLCRARRSCYQTTRVWRPPAVRLTDFPQTWDLQTPV